MYHVQQIIEGNEEKEQGIRHNRDNIVPFRIIPRTHLKPSRALSNKYKYSNSVILALISTSWSYGLGKLMYSCSYLNINLGLTG